MQQRQLGFWLSVGLFAAVQSSASAADAPAQAASPTTGATAATVAAQAPDKDGAKKHRLRFRTQDGTCACTCASGGTSEADIRKAQEARERAGS